MILVSRRRTYAPQMLCEGVSAIHPISAALSLTCQTARPSRTLHFGLRESPFLAAKEALTTQVKTLRTIPQEILPLHQTKTRLSAEIFERVKQASIPTLVPLDYSCITNQYNFSSEKLGITASVCLSLSVNKVSLVDNSSRQLLCLSRCYRPLQHQQR